MNNHFTVTIHDENGVKQINLHKFVKKALMYTLVFIVFLVLSAAGTILYLDYSIDVMQDKKESVERAYKHLKEQNRELLSSVNTTKDSLLLKKQELDDFSDALSEIQSMIGMAPIEKEASLQEQLDLTKLSSKQMLTLLQLIPSGSPIEYKGITSKYGYRTHPTLKKREFHKGLDMKAQMKTPVYAPADGIVEFAGRNSGYGRLVILQHAYGFRTYYGHLKKIVVKSTKYVRKGDLIAYTGSSGLSNGPHLHYEIRFMYTTLNPYWFIKWSVENYNTIFIKEKKVPWQSLVTMISNLRVVKPTQTLPSSLPEQK